MASSQFWKPAPGVDPDALRSELEGQPTIFVSIASYRDSLCHNTLEEALKWADYPRRLVFGVVEQNALHEAPELRCDYTPKPCSEEPSQSLCRHRSQLRLLRVDAAKARGPCFGRHRSERLYRGEHFVMQLDAHSFFVKGWDTKIIEQWRETGNEYAVLSTYPSDYRYFDSAKGQIAASSPHTVPVMCRAKFVEDGMVRPDAAGEVSPKVGKTPILAPLWGAGIAFSRGHRILRVPYDCCLDMMFAGEEFSMAARMWTHGYDFYAPNPTVAYHWYARPKPPRLFWENSFAAPRAAARSARRVLAMLGDPPAHGEYDASDIAPGDTYGLGKRRPLQIFLRLFGFNITKRSVRDRCKWVLPQTMHEELTPYLRADGKGIDYSRVPVQELLDRHFPNSDKHRQCAYGSVQEGFLPGCCQSCQGYVTLEEAKHECSQEEKCTGVTSISSRRFELRLGSEVLASPSGEKSYVRGKCEG